VKLLQRTLAAFALILLSLSVVGAEPSKKAKRTKDAPKIVYTGQSDVKITDDLLKQLLQFMQLRSVLFTAPRPCVLQPGGVCVIEVPIILLKDPTSGADYCVGLFPEEVSLAGTAAGNPEKTIVWSLIRPSSAPANATFTFFDDKATVGKAPGIIILNDKKKQLHGGTLGDGTTTPPDATKWLVKNKHVLTGKAVYIPVVVRTDDPGGAAEKVSVCGTPDPRIAND